MLNVIHVVVAVKIWITSENQLYYRTKGCTNDTMVVFNKMK